MRAVLPAVLFVVGMFGVFMMGFLTARIRISRYVFGAWLDAQRETSGAEYWLRSRDYHAAWDAYLAADLPFRRLWEPEGHKFTDEPDYPVDVTFARNTVATQVFTRPMVS